MISAIKSVLPPLTLAFDIVLVFVIIALAFRKSWGTKVAGWVGKHALGLSLLVALAGISGSLFYSNVVGYVPCDLCWWQRIFIYPQAVILFVAWRRGLEGVFRFTIPLSWIAVLISTYHSYVQLSGYSPLPCSITASCTKVYVLTYGYVTIPTMALSIGVALLTLAYARRFYDSRKS